MEKAPNQELETARKNLERTADGWKRGIETYTSQMALKAYRSFFTALVTDVPESLQDVAKGALHNIANNLRTLLSPTSELVSAINLVQPILSPKGGGSFAKIDDLAQKIDDLARELAQLAGQTKLQTGATAPTLASLPRNESEKRQQGTFEILTLNLQEKNQIDQEIIPKLEAIAQLSRDTLQQIYTKEGKLDTTTTYLTQFSTFAEALANFWRDVCEYLSQEAHNILQQARANTTEDQATGSLPPLEETVATWYETIEAKLTDLQNVDAPYHGAL